MKDLGIVLAIIGVLLQLIHPTQADTGHWRRPKPNSTPCPAYLPPSFQSLTIRVDHFARPRLLGTPIGGLDAHLLIEADRPYHIGNEHLGLSFDYTLGSLILYSPSVATLYGEPRRDVSVLVLRSVSS